MAKRHKLKNLSLDEVSLVDAGANQKAFVILAKAREATNVKGVKFVLGFPKEGSSKIQTVVFDSSIWTKAKAKEWLKNHKMSSSKVDETDSSLRFRQADPSGFERFRTITPGSQVEKALVAQTSWGAIEELVDRELRERFGKDDSGNFRSVWPRDFWGDQVVFNIEKDTFRTEFQIDTNATPMKATVGEPIPVEVVYRDKTAKREGGDDVSIERFPASKDASKDPQSETADTGGSMSKDNTTTSVEELQKKVDDLQSKAEEREAELKKQLDEAKAEAAKSAKAVKRFEVLSGLSEDDLGVVKAWSDEEQQKFVDADEAGRTKMLETHAASKAEADKVPDAVQKRLDTLAKRVEDAEAAQKKAEDVAKAAEKRANEDREARHMIELVKKAEEEYPGLPGTPDEKAAALRSIEDLPEGQREGVYKLLKAGSAAGSQQMKIVGKDASTTPSGAEALIEKKAMELVAKDPKLTVADAWDKVLIDEPDLYTKYNEEKRQLVGA